MAHAMALPPTPSVATPRVARGDSERTTTLILPFPVEMLAALTDLSRAMTGGGNGGGPPA